MSNVRIPELTPAIGLDGSELLEIAVLVAPGQYVSRRTTAGLIAGAGPVTGVTPGTYGDSAHVGQFTVDATGRLTFAGNVPINTVGIGTVTSVSVATANGFSATITNPTTTPNITLQTSVNGILLGDGTGVSAASTTGSGAVVLANTPTLITPNIGTATGTGLQLSGLTASSAVATDASKNLVSVTNTGTGNNVLQTSPTLITPILGAASGTSLQLSSLTASSAVATDGSKNLVSVTNTGSGNNVLATSPTLVTPILGAASATTINKITITQPASGATLTIQDGYTLTVDGNAIVNGNNTGDQTITLTGDVTGSGTGSFATTIANNAVTLAKMATVATASILGRSTAGTGNVQALTGTQATALLVPVVGDSGSGGTQGLVPAPGAGDAASGKFLKADGTFAVPAGSGSGTVLSVAVATANGFAGTVADPTLNPIITITTTITGILQGNGTAISAASTTGSGAVVLATSPTLVTPALGTPSAIVLTNATGLPIAGITGLGTGVGTWLATPSSANLANAVTDETGSGALVFANTPTLVTPVLGVATATSINKVAITAPATSATLTLIDGTTVTGPASSGTMMTLGNVETVTGAKTFNDGKLLLAGSSSGTTTLKASATASGTITLPAATDTLMGKATTDTMTNKTFDTAGTGNSLAINGTAITAVTGTGSVVLATSPTITTPTIAKLANLTSNGLVTTSGGDGTLGITVPGTGILTWLATPSSANLAAAMTDETGSGALVFATSPTLVTPTLGAATATSINKMAITAPATSSTLAVADGKTFTASNSLTLAGTDSTTMTFPSTSSTVLTTGNTATITKGYTVTPNSLGNMTNFTIDPSLGNYQYGTNHAAFTLTAPASDCAIDLLVTNDATAGAITFSGFTVGSSTGSALTTTNTNKFIISIRRINSVATYSIYALQ